MSDFIQELDHRGGEADIWLVYLADPYEEVQGGAVTLVLQQACWTRGAAYSFAHAERQRGLWRHYYVFRLTADRAWAASTDGATPVYETAFGRDRELPPITITAAGLLTALEP